MAGYREITVAGGDGRSGRAAAKVRRAPPRDREGWRPVVARGLARGLALGWSEGSVLCREKPGSVFGAVVALGAAGFICFNALSYQTGRHPAPILPKLPAKVASKAPAEVANKAPAEAVSKAPAEPTPALRDAVPEPVKAASTPKPRDAIAELIRAEDTTASVTPKVKPAPAAKAELSAPDPAVMRAQRALAKLGYGQVKADGALGPATKAAIEKFERDRKLPVTGEAAGRTLRALESKAAKG